MQTFLPFASFERTARVLDRQRLGKQRVETLQIMIALLENRGWVHHPAVKMWRGHEGFLLNYQHAICFEWTDIRHYNDTCLDRTRELYFRHRPGVVSNDPPWWLGEPQFHESHQSSLLRKVPDYYGPIFPGVPDDIPYFWPE